MYPKISEMHSRSIYVTYMFSYLSVGFSAYKLTYIYSLNMTMTGNFLSAVGWQTIWEGR